MFTSSRAIVLNKVRHTDSTFIATLYTEQAGSVSFAVRIPKTSRAGIKPQLFQPLTFLSIEWDHREQRPLQRLRNIQLLAARAPSNSPKGEDFGSASPLGGIEGGFGAGVGLPLITTFLAETLYHALRHETRGDVFPFLYDSLCQHLTAPPFKGDRGILPLHFAILFLYQLTDHLGIGINADTPTSLPFFDLMEGEYTPTQPQHLYYLQGQDARFVHTLRRLSYPTLHLLRLTPEQQHRALRALVAYYRIHVPDFPKLRSLDLLRELLA